MNPAPTRHKLSWMAEFVAAIPKYRDNTIATTRLAIAARQHLFSWAEAEGIDFNHERKGILHIYRNKAGFAHAGKVSKLLAAGGLERRTVTPDEMRAIEPTLQGSYYGGYFTESDSTGDIHKYTHGLAQACARMGVSTLYGTEVLRTSSNGKTALVHLRSAQGEETLVSDAVVVCAGVQGRALAAQLATGSTFTRSRVPPSPWTWMTPPASKLPLRSACLTMKRSWSPAA